MPTLLSPANVREHVETDLLDPAIQRLLDDADAEIVRRFGAHTGAITEVVDGGGEGLILLSRPVAGITSVTERVGLTDTVLAANDYQTWFSAGGRLLERLDSGTNGRDGWGERITVVYTPADEQPERRRVELDLVKIAIAYEALKSRTVGDLSESWPDYSTERESILSVLAPFAVA